MALSEQERRMLQEIEQALIAEDPSLAKQASGSGGGQGGGGVTVGIRSVAVLLLGLCVLIAGIALSQNSLWFVAMAAVGFFIMFGGGLLGGSGEISFVVPAEELHRVRAQGWRRRGRG